MSNSFDCCSSTQFDLSNGCRLEKGLCPGEVLRSEPQQRVHPVYNDGDWIWCAACMRSKHACTMAAVACGLILIQLESTASAPVEHINACNCCVQVVWPAAAANAI